MRKSTILLCANMALLGALLYCVSQGYIYTVFALNSLQWVAFFWGRAALKAECEADIARLKENFRQRFAR